MPKKYFPLYSNKFVETIQRKEEKGFKPAKIHYENLLFYNVICGFGLCVHLAQ